MKYGLQIYHAPVGLALQELDAPGQVLGHGNVSQDAEVRRA